MRDPRNNTSPVFIFGNARSGTSLLSRMLNCHPRICVPYEAHIYNVFWDFKDRYEPLTDPLRMRRLIQDFLSMRVFRDWSDPPSTQDVIQHVQRPDFHGAFEALMCAWADGQNKPRWGEKTPHHGLYWRALLEGFPDARFIHLVRDGRDCALSWAKARFGPKMAYPAAIRWSRYVDEIEKFKQAADPKQFLEIRYEDLIGDPEMMLRQVCDFIDESFDPAMLNHHQQKDNYMTDKRNQVNLKRPVMRSNAGKWQTQMSPKAQTVFEAVAGTQLKRYGYPLLHTGATVSAWDRFRYRYLMHPPLRMISMLRNTKGLVDGLVVLRIKTRLALSPRGTSGQAKSVDMRSTRAA